MTTTAGKSLKTITIVGGGLAGLTLGIGLRQRGIPVKIFEAGKYPRHRVCGEFISGRGQHSLERLGLRDKLICAGAQIAKTAAFFSGNISFRKNLPESALCISRFVLDNLLADEFCQLGGDLQSGYRRAGSFGEGTVRATGRRIQNVVEGWRLFGLKVHARNLSLEADLEMHFVPNGYVGLCRLDHGEINICGLFRGLTTQRNLSTEWRALLKGEAGSVLETRFAQAEFDESSFSSIAGLSLAPHKGLEQRECAIGDSVTMIPPVTGNGMSMAFESAELAIEPLADFSLGKISWSHAQRSVAGCCDQIFARRLIWSKYLQSVVFHPRLRNSVLMLMPRLPGLWSAFFSHTR